MNYGIENTFEIRWSEKMNSKQLSSNLPAKLIDNVLSIFLEAKPSGYCRNWEMQMERELDLINKGKIWEIIEMP